MDNLRLIVIIVIFIGIIVVLLYLKSVKSGRKTERKYMHAANPYDRSSKEERHSADVVDDSLSIEEEIKDVRVEITTKIEELILKMEEGASVGISFSDESANTEVVEEVSVKTKEEGLDIPSEVSEDIKAEGEEQIASSEVIEGNVLEVDEGDSADFDIQEFLEELGNLPSEKEPEAEK